MNKINCTTICPFTFSDIQKTKTAESTFSSQAEKKNVANDVYKTVYAF